MINVLLQVQDSLAAQTANQAVAEDMNLLDLAMKGGIIMIPLLLLLIMSVYIFVERFIVIRQAAKNDNSFMERIKDFLHEGKIEDAKSLCQRTNTPYARMVAKGLSRLNRPMNDVQVSIENAGNYEVSNLEKGLSLLATTAGGGPMLGFLGTVCGMIQAFYNMASAGNNVDVTNLAGGIYTAMVTTVAGLIVGVIAYFAYNYLVSMVDKVVRDLEARSLEFMDILNEPAN